MRYLIFFSRILHLFNNFTKFRGRKIYEPPRYMSCSQAAEQLLEIIENKRDEGQNEIGMLKFILIRF